MSSPLIGVSCDLESSSLPGTGKEAPLYMEIPFTRVDFTYKRATSTLFAGLSLGLLFLSSEEASSQKGTFGESASCYPSRFHTKFSPSGSETMAREARMKARMQLTASLPGLSMDTASSCGNKSYPSAKQMLLPDFPSDVLRWCKAVLSLLLPP